MPAKTKPLSHLKDKSKGSIHHMEIHPALNSKGKLAFTTRIHRNRPSAAQAKMDAGGNYTPEPPPEETVHEQPEDMMNHVGKTFGVKPQAEEPDEDDQDEEE